MSAQSNQLVATQPNQEYQFRDVAPAFPSELKMLNRWVVRNAKKLPFSAFEEDENLGTIDSSDGQYQADYDTALGALEQTTKYSGLGFVFNYADGLTGVDFDDCVNAETRKIRPDIQSILARTDSYSEFSPSGTGLHIIVKGWQFPIGPEDQQGAKVGKAEIYSGKRYFTVSGDHIPGTPASVNIRNLDWLYERIVKNKEFVVAKTSSNPGSESDCDSSCVVTKKSTAITTKYETLMNGTIVRSKENNSQDFAIEDDGQILSYESQSSADYALLRLIADKLNTEDAEVIKSEFLKSPLGQRNKAAKGDYIDRSIAKLLKSYKTAKPREVTEADLEVDSISSPVEHTLTDQEYEAELDEEYPVIPLAEQAGPSWDDGILYGPTGEFIKKASQYNEAHPAGMLLDLLVALGNIFGRNPYFNINSTRHYTNESLARAGDSSYSRKGGGRDAIDEPLRFIDPAWFNNRVMSGFGSPEAIISNLRDDTEQQRLDKKTNSFIKTRVPGIADKRLCIREGELASVFVLASKPESRADIVLRDAWDGKPIRNIVKGKTDGISNSAVCMEPHISISGDTTRSELIAKMPSGADENGFGNRFLYCYVYRVKLCPNGGPPIDWTNEIIYFHEAVQFAKEQKYVPLSPAARKLSVRMYLEIENDKLPGLAGKMTSRAAAHIRRLALIYAMCDKSPVVESKHLQAAKRLWDYCSESARYIFNKYTKEQLYILRYAEKKGMVDLKKIREELFHRNKLAGWIKAQVDDLVRHGYLLQTGNTIKFIKK
jgi:hypothetical protein